MLSYNVSKLLREPVGATLEYEFDDRVLIDEATPQFEQMSGHARFLRTDDGVLLTATASGIQHDQCSRCLQDIDVPLTLHVEDEFFATVDPATGAALPKPDDPEAFLIDAQHTLDIEEALRQAWTAALPLQPLCRADCRGLCPGCGRDLNQDACVCPPEEDQRWSPLRELARTIEGN